MSRIFKPDSGQALEIQDEGGSAALTIETNGDVTVDAENLVIGTAGKGIDFSNQASPAAGMTSELLDSYEEGTWTAQLADASGNNMTMQAAYTTGAYTKIGNLVHVSGYFHTSSIGSASGEIRITGLPFAVADSNSAFSGGGAGYGHDFAITAGTSIACYAGKAGSYISLIVWDLTSGISGMQATEWTADGKTMIGLSYRAA